MNVIIIGCGKTGSRIARQLDERGCDVSVVDSTASKFDNLGSDFSGLAVSGEATDTEVLRNAGAENANFAIVVTPDDNLNVMVGQILKLEFEIEQVYVRVLDPTREAVFRKFGLHTICPTRFESDFLFNLATKDDLSVETVTIGSSTVQFETVRADRRTVDKKPSEIPSRKNEMPFAIKKKTGQIILCNNEDVVIEDGDKIVFAAVWED